MIDTGACDHASPTVLVLSPEVSGRALLVHLLGQWGLDTRAASSDAEARAVLRSTRIDAIVSRPTTPPRGPSPLAGIRTGIDTELVPLIVVTDDPDPSLRSHLVDEGAADVVVEPHELSELVDRVRNQLRAPSGDLGARLTRALERAGGRA
ncbi:MAG: response regulator [Acidimicrobiales bacterium]